MRSVHRLVSGWGVKRRQNCCGANAVFSGVCWLIGLYIESAFKLSLRFNYHVLLYAAQEGDKIDLNRSNLKKIALLITVPTYQTLA